MKYLLKSFTKLIKLTSCFYDFPQDVVLPHNLLTSKIPFFTHTTAELSRRHPKSLNFGWVQNSSANNKCKCLGLGPPPIFSFASFSFSWILNFIETFGTCCIPDENDEGIVSANAEQTKALSAGKPYENLL